MEKIQMVDLKKQLLPIRKEVEIAISNTLDNTQFIQGAAVSKFENELKEFLNCSHVITCGNGTDALQIALMALELQPGDEVVVPAFTYISAIEVIVLLQLKPIFVDVQSDSYNLNPLLIEDAISEKTKAIIAVHLFGQMCAMGAIMAVAKANDLWVIEDNAQSFGSKTLEGGQLSGTIGHIGCNSFFPTKILGGMGDGGSINTEDADLAYKIRMICQHGQERKYYHKRVGVNSRLDSIQAAVLSIKLKSVEQYIDKRKWVAEYYDSQLCNFDKLNTPIRSHYSDHVYHQYTVKIRDGRREELRAYLRNRDIPSAVYYPVTTNKQEAYEGKYGIQETPVSEALTKQVLSLPMHTELSEDQLNYICDGIISFYS